MSVHREFEISVNEIRKNLRMNLAIFRGLFFSQIAFLVFFAVQKFNQSFTSGQLPVLEDFLPLAIASFGVYLLWPVILYLFHRRSQRRQRQRTKRGATLIAEDALRALLPDGSLPLSDGLFLPRALETTHVFIGGSTGSGKTQCLSRVILSTRQRQEKALIQDAKDGEFVAKFFDEATDIIFNPFDARSVSWNIFEMIESEADYDAVAASVVPKGRGQEQFFCNAARDVLAAILRHCALSGERSNRRVWQWLSKPVPELHKMLVLNNSPAASSIESHDSGQTQGVMATLHQFAKIFRYLAEDGKQRSFSLRQWVRDPKARGFIFLSSSTKQRETLKGIHTLFIDSLANEILSLRDDPDRRIFIMADEFGALHPLSSIKDLLALGRSKGCSFFLGAQEKAQIDALYGRDVANTIVNQCNTFLIFRMNDSDSAEYFCKMFGEQEIETMETSFSSAIRDHRDSESYRNMKLTERLVLPSEIQSLPNLSFYLKISGYPLTRSGISYRHYPDIARAFVPNERFRVTASPEAAKEGRPTSDSEDLLDELDL